MAGINWLAMFGPSLEQLFGLTGPAGTAARAILFLVQTVAGIYFAAWFVAWSQGNSAIGPVGSTRIMHGYFWRTVALMVVAIVPLMALHYAGLIAIGRPEWLVWALIVLDSFVVGFLALTMHGAIAVAAQGAAEAKGIQLDCPDMRAEFVAKPPEARPAGS